ncbi:MAG: 2-hydroxychromene-2-carboxylate isomerase [Halioglobus sp.]
MATVEFVFDFGSPNAYLSYKVLPDILARTGGTLALTPVLLGGVFKLTGNQPPMQAFGGVQGKLEYEQIETQRFIARHKLTAFTFNPHFPVNTIAIMRGLFAAQELGCEARYVDVVLAAMWEEGLKMDDAPVVHTALQAGGLDADVIVALTQTQSIKDQLKANTQNAVGRGVYGVPTFFVGSDMFFGKDRLGQVEEALNSAG